MLKRQSATLDRPVPSEGVFTFNRFREDDDDDNQGGRPAKRPTRVASPVLQSGNEVSAMAPQDATHGCSAGSQMAVGRQENRVGGFGSIRQDRVPLEDGWQVDRILKESQPGSDFEAVVTKTVWLTKADLDPKLLREVQG